jgi:hypothetical protein
MKLNFIKVNAYECSRLNAFKLLTFSRFQKLTFLVQSKLFKVNQIKFELTMPTYGISYKHICTVSMYGNMSRIIPKASENFQIGLGQL